MPTDDTEKKFFFLFVCFMCEKKRPEITLKEVTRFHFPSVNTNHLFSLLFLPLFHSPLRILVLRRPRSTCIYILQRRTGAQAQSEGSISMQILDYPSWE